MDSTTCLNSLSERARTVRSSAVRDLLRLTEQPHVLSLAGGLPAPELLPVERVRAATIDVLDRLGSTVLQYGPTEGVGALRDAIAQGLGGSARAADTVITTGSQQGLDLVARAILDPGDVVVVESPTYLGALSALHWTAPRIVGIDGDADGLRTDLLEDRLRAGLRPKLVYVVTEFANPTGATLSADRRRDLAALADRYGFVIVEDNPYGKLRFRGPNLPSIRTWSDRTVTLGTASKILSPGLRVGWLTAPEWLSRPIVIAKQGTDLHTSGLNQHIVLSMLQDESWLNAHVATLVSTYSERASALLAALSAYLGHAIEVREPDGGMFVWARLIDREAASEPLLAAALERGVAFVPGSAFRPDATDDGTLRMCFTTLSPAALGEAMSRLATALPTGVLSASAAR
jgi:2-aminoadipate transaminase